MPRDTLEELFLRELYDLYSAERQLLEALPKMAQAAASEELRGRFAEQMAQTAGHAKRLEKIFAQLGKRSQRTICPAIQGLLHAGSAIVSESATPEVKDVGLIVAAQRVEHYEIAGYGAACTFAHLLGHAEAAEILRQTLEEVQAHDERLSKLVKAEFNMAAGLIGGSVG